MPEHNGATFDQIISNNELITTALQTAGRDAALTHARLGRSIPEWRNGRVEWLSPAEIFARYGLDEFGRPKTE